MPYTTQEEHILDDEMLDKLDPHANAKWDKIEGERERTQVKEGLRSRLSPTQDTELDLAILKTINLLTEYDDIVS